MTTAILVPRRSDGAERDRLWSYARARWAVAFPDWPIIEGHHDDGPFNRSAACNQAAALAGDWHTAIVIDADVLPDENAVRSAVAIAAGTGGPACAYDRRLHLTARGTVRILEQGYRGSWEPLVKHDLRDSVSGAYAVRRDLWDAVGGFDELFVGWGWEDIAFRIATETISGRHMARVVGNLWHLWHPKSPENSSQAATWDSNQARGTRYKQSRWNRPAVEELIAEAGGARGPLPAPPARPSTIPRILHRTVPETTTVEVDLFWERATELHPGWQMLEHRDPLDPVDWPETGDLWTRCTSGAQRAGLIRLEALWRWGGVYLDSDVEPYRNLEPLLALEGFAAWEDRKVAPDAVLAARPQHPAVAIMLERARAEVVAGRGAWASGPGVTTSVLPGRPDWLLLPPGSFYPYHYTDKATKRDEDHAAAQPWAFAAHHWHHSWEGR